MSKPTQFNDWPEEIQPGFGPYRMTAERVVDGDTVYCFVDLGLNQYAYVSLRLKDVDAPEIFSGPAHVREWGKVARARLEQILPQGTKVKVYTTKDKQSFARYEAEIFTWPGFCINDELSAWMNGQEWWPAYLEYKEAA